MHAQRKKKKKKKEKEKRKKGKRKKKKEKKSLNMPEEAPHVTAREDDHPTPFISFPACGIQVRNEKREGEESKGGGRV